MSDAGIAPAPAATEVPINESPVNTPTPVGQQAPDKPVGADHKGSEHRPQSRREAIQAAFDRAEKERGKVEPAKPRMGHNQPPEPMQRERDKPKEPPLDLKKRPDDQPKADERPRAEHGHFAARERQRDTEREGVQTVQTVRELPVSAPYSRPVARMDDAAKADWHATPESVRGSMHRMHDEFSRAYQAYRGDHETMESIRPFHQMAQQHGTTLDRALSNYVSMEQKLRSDPIGGLDLIINNLNLQTPQGNKLTLQDVAWHIVNQTPEQHALMQSKNRMMAQTHQLHAANERIAALENAHREMQYASHFRQTRGAVDQYAAQRPRFDELSDLIEQEVKIGYDLDTAYRRAELLRPATQAPQTRTDGTQAPQTRTATAQTRNSDRSIHGGPDGSEGASRRNGKPVGRREAIANAMKRVGNGFA